MHVLITAFTVAPSRLAFKLASAKLADKIIYYLCDNINIALTFAVETLIFESKYIIMKKLSITLLAIIVFTACSSNKKQENELLKNILKVHDKVMGRDEALMKNKMVLDSLLKLPAKDTAEKTNMKAIELKLTTAEEAMEIWMQKFDSDVINKKPHDEIVKYYNEQEKSIKSVDSLMDAAVNESTKYLSDRAK